MLYIVFSRVFFVHHLTKIRFILPLVLIENPIKMFSSLSLLCFWTLIYILADSRLALMSIIAFRRVPFHALAENFFVALTIHLEFYHSLFLKLCILSFQFLVFVQFFAIGDMCDFHGISIFLLLLRSFLSLLLYLRKPYKR